MADDSSDIGAIINAALAVYGIKQSDRPPKFYNAPPTPQDQWTTDAKHSLFNYASSYTDQYLRGLNSGQGLNPNSHLSTTAFGDPSFMGGIKIPQIDFSKMPSAPSGTPSTSTPSTNPSGTQNNTPLDNTTPAPKADNPAMAPSTSPSSGGAPSGPVGGAPSGPSGSSDANSPAFTGSVKAWWQNFQQEHPNWSALGTGLLGAALTVAFGPMAGAAFKLLAHLGSSGGIDPNAIDPNTGKAYGDFLGGSQDSGSNPLNPSQPNGNGLGQGIGGTPEYLPGWGNGPTFSGGGGISASDMTPANNKDPYSVFDEP